MTPQYFRILESVNVHKNADYQKYVPCVRNDKLRTSHKLHFLKYKYSSHRTITCKPLLLMVLVNQATSDNEPHSPIFGYPGRSDNTPRYFSPSISQLFWTSGCTSQSWCSDSDIHRCRSWQFECSILQWWDYTQLVSTLPPLRNHKIRRRRSYNHRKWNK